MLLIINLLKMKKSNIYKIILGLLLVLSNVIVAQTKVETYAVNGECEMCKKTIEETAKKAGATDSEWD